MDDGSPQVARALIGGIEYCFAEKLASAANEGEIVVCEASDGARRYATCEAWEAGYARFEASRLADEGVVTSMSSGVEKLALFNSLFAMRGDVYAKSYFNKKAGRVGYTPACTHEWERGVCGKPRVKCADCPQREFLPLDDATLLAHFRGSGWEGVGVVAGYPLIDDDKTCVLAVDFDKDDWQQAVGAFRDVCEREGVPVAIERSRSGNGAHAWMFFSEPVTASDARKLGCALLTRAMRIDPSVRFESYDRLFPSQDSTPTGGFGNPIALPFQGDARRDGNSLFVSASFQPYADQWRFLSSVKHMTQDDLVRLLRHFGKRILGDLADADASSASELLDVEASAHSGGGGDAALPWASKARAKLGSGDMPAQVRIVRSNLLFVSKEGLSAAAIDRIRRVAAFGNPDFYRAQAMRQSVYGKERVLHFDEDAGDWIGLPRGCESSVAELLATCGAQPAFEEARCEGRPIKVEFKGTLRPEQAPAVEALAACDIGVLVAPPAFGKTVAAASLIARRKVSTLILVEKVTLLEQWKERLEQFLEIDEELPELLTPTGRKSRKKRSIIGQIGGGKRLPSGVIDIALVPALFEKGDLPGEKRVMDLVGSYGMVICDECHHVSAFSFEKVMRAVKARYVHGLTGTPKRSDGLQAIAFMQCGPVRYQVGKDAAGEEEPLARVMVPRFTKTRLDGADQENFTQLVDGLCVDAARNGLIVQDVARVLDGGGMALVLTRRVEHAATLEKALAAQGCETMLLVGSDPQRIKREKLRMLGQFASGKPFAIVATGSYVGEGFDDDRLDALFMAGPVSWSGLVAQYVGRLHRRREGKDEVVVYDYVDVNVRMLDRMYRKRLKEYAAQGYELRPAVDEGDVRGEFVTPESYLERFELDVANTAKTLVIASSEVHKRRSELLAPCLEAAVARGVDVRAALPNPEDAKPKKVQAINDAAALLKQAGVQVLLREACPNLVVADSSIVWYGGIAPFAYPRADDQVLRFTSGEVARELEELLREITLFISEGKY